MKMLYRLFFFRIVTFLFTRGWLLLEHISNANTHSKSIHIHLLATYIVDNHTPRKKYSAPPKDYISQNFSCRRASAFERDYSIALDRWSTTIDLEKTGTIQCVGNNCSTSLSSFFPCRPPKIVSGLNASKRHRKYLHSLIYLLYST